MGYDCSSRKVMVSHSAAGFDSWQEQEFSFYHRK
jgi:hypothetical protein